MKQAPNVTFLDPAESVAKKVSTRFKPSKRNSMKIFSSSNPKKFQKLLEKIKIKNKVTSLS